MREPSLTGFTPGSLRIGFALLPGKRGRLPFTGPFQLGYLPLELRNLLLQRCILGLSLLKLRFQFGEQPTRLRIL